MNLHKIKVIEVIYVRSVRQKYQFKLDSYCFLIYASYKTIHSRYELNFLGHLSSFLSPYLSGVQSIVGNSSSKSTTRTQASAFILPLRPKFGWPLSTYSISRKLSKTRISNVRTYIQPCKLQPQIVILGSPFEHSCMTTEQVVDITLISFLNHLCKLSMEF